MSTTSTILARRALAVTAVAVGAVVMLPGMAWAAFPGSNGAIVFQSTRQGTAPGCPSTSSELFSIPPAGGSATQETCTGFTDQHAFVDPDGTEVVFSSNRAGGSSTYQLYTVPLTTDGNASDTPVDVSYPQNVGSDDYPFLGTCGARKPGNHHLPAHAPGASPQLYTENVNTPSSPAVPVFSSPTGFSDTQPVYDPSNANEIAFVRQALGGPEQIFTYNLSTPSTPPVNLSAADNGGVSSNDSKPDFAPFLNGSPGVQYIVFESDRPSAPNAVNGPCVGTQLYTMTDQPGSAVTPVFQTWNRSGGTLTTPTGTQLCTTSTGSPSGTKVATENPVFSPDGTEVAYDQAGPDSEDVFYAYETPYVLGAGQMVNAVDLTPNFSTDEAPNWAPTEPGASTPEVPVTILLPTVGLGVIGAVVFFRRRRMLA